MICVSSEYPDQPGNRPSLSLFRVFTVVSIGNPSAMLYTFILTVRHSDQTGGTCMSIPSLIAQAKILFGWSNVFTVSNFCMCGYGKSVPYLKANILHSQTLQLKAQANVRPRRHIHVSNACCMNYVYPPLNAFNFRGA